MAVPSEILSAFGFSPEGIEKVTGGLINATYSVKSAGVPIAALQQLHPVFAATVNIDIEAISDILAALGMTTPTLIRTAENRLYAVHEDKVWRALSWVPGKCYGKIPSLKVAEEGAKLIARFHRALDGHDYQFQFKREGVHDTSAHLRKLRMVQCETRLLPDGTESLRQVILSQAESLPALPSTPNRIIHGDLKISNLLFNDDDSGLCLIDLDTMARGSIAYELGDALRSWANPQGENVACPSIDVDILAAVARGYAQEGRGILSTDEIGSVVTGLETVSLELAARFCVDAFEDSYFGWDPSRFASRRTHNLMRSRGQLSLSRSVASRRPQLQELWAAPFIR
ncbi:MAG: aminoglycoside phosphotransferase family protein [Kofleriaceae bacterium]|nr:aminoglycoside phosphotransferase family protein [Kofleriaceae bacterium]